MKPTYYRIQSPREDLRIRLAVASDLHGCESGEILEALEREKPDLILIPGDLTDDAGLRDEQNQCYAFLSACARIAPTYYSLGNHEIACYHKGNPWRHPIPVPLTDEIRARIAGTGAILLENDSVAHGALRICGMTSGINGKRNAPDVETLRRFSEEASYRILLCHHPEYFVPYIVLAIVYLVLVLAITWLIKLMEKRLAKNER
jgi:3',5'-cyclic AMP phosphodiesterase CpdA